MKKALTLLVAICFMLALTMPVFAANGGTITVGNTKVGEDYDLYQILDLTTDSTGSKFSYTVPANGLWDDFYLQSEVQAILNIDPETGVVTWKNGVDQVAGAENLAKLALSYVQQSASIDAVASKTAEADTVVFDGLEYGYYLLNTSIGSICALDSNNANVTINDKHGTPVVEKLVAPDGTTQYAPVNTAQIGDVIGFKATLDHINDVKNLVFTDNMANGLTLNESSIVVTCGGKPVTAGDNTYRVVREAATPQIFQIKFADGHHDLSAADSIVITYTATVNDQAVIGGLGNINEAKLAYGNSQSSTASGTTTFVYGFSIQKTDTQNNPLAGAEFVLGRGTTNQEYAVFANNKLTGWTTDKTAATLASPANGLIVLEGLDAGTYFIEETEAPAGYNKITDPIALVIDETGAITADNAAHEDKIVEIVNATGLQLPSTGGFGTTLFIVIGTVGILVLGIFLVTNKRMKKEGF